MLQNKQNNFVMLSVYKKSLLRDKLYYCILKILILTLIRRKHEMVRSLNVNLYL